MLGKRDHAFTAIPSEVTAETTAGYICKERRERKEKKEVMSRS